MPADDLDPDVLLAAVIEAVAENLPGDRPRTYSHSETPRLRDPWARATWRVRLATWMSGSPSADAAA